MYPVPFPFVQTVGLDSSDSACTHTRAGGVLALVGGGVQAQVGRRPLVQVGGGIGLSWGNNFTLLFGDNCITTVHLSSYNLFVHTIATRENILVVVAPNISNKYLTVPKKNIWQ